MNICSVVRPIVWIAIALAASSAQALPVGDLGSMAFDRTPGLPS